MFPIVRAREIIKLPVRKALSALDELFLTFSPYATPQERNVALDRIKQLEEETKNRKKEKPQPRVFLVFNTEPQLDTPQDVMLFKRHLVKR